MNDLRQESEYSVIGKETKFVQSIRNEGSVKIAAGLTFVGRWEDYSSKYSLLRV